MNGQSFQMVSKLDFEGLKITYKVYFYRMRKAWRMSGIALGVAAIALGVFNLFRWVLLQTPRPPIFSLNTGLFALYIVLGIFAILLPRIRVHTTAKKLYTSAVKSKFPTQTSRTISDLGIESVNEQSTSKIKWEQIEKGYLVGNRVVLLCGQMIILLDPNDITDGNKDDFLPFIQGKVVLKDF